MFLVDPFGRASRLIPEKLLHRIIRAGAVLIFSSMFLKRGHEYHTYYVKPLWFVETLIYFVLLTAFLVRTDPVLPDELPGGLSGSVMPPM